MTIAPPFFLARTHDTSHALPQLLRYTRLEMAMARREAGSKLLPDTPSIKAKKAAQQMFGKRLSLRDPPSSRLLDPRHDMQKLQEHNPALEGCLSTLEDEWLPLQRESDKYSQWPPLMPGGMENRLHRNSICVVGIPEWAEDKNLVAFIEAWHWPRCFFTHVFSGEGT